MQNETDRARTGTERNMNRRRKAVAIAPVALLAFALAAYVTARASDGPEAPRSVQVTPAQATVRVDSSLQLSASLRDETGNEVPGHQFSWWSPDVSIARVDQNGLVTGMGPGSVAIAAITEDRSESGFADIAVVRSPTAGEIASVEPDPGPPPPSATVPSESEQTPSDPDPDPLPEPQLADQDEAPRLNEPDGFEFMTSRQFDEYDENGWKDRHHGRTQKIEDGVMRITFPTGFKGGSAPGQAAAFFGGKGGLGQVYLAFDYLLSANWQGHGSGMNKIWFFNGPETGNTIATVKAYGEPGATQFPVQVTVKQTENAVVGRRSTNLMPNRGGPKLKRGTQHLVEIVIKMNSASGRHDGELHIWVDGVRTHEYTPANGKGVNWWEKERQSRIGQVKWTPVWGGIGRTVSQRMYAEMSHAYVSGLK